MKKGLEVINLGKQQHNFQELTFIYSYLEDIPLAQNQQVKEMQFRKHKRSKNIPQN